MSDINHFQTYSQRENHVTNNTLLMLRHVYRTSPRLLGDVLRGLLEDAEIEVGPRFEQQVGAAHSIPDAVISQKPLNIYVETKRDDGLYDGQLERHMKSIANKNHPADSSYLIGLTVNAINENDSERWRSIAAGYDVTFISTTYRQLLDLLGQVSAAFPDLSEVYDDFELFISRENLVPDQYRKLVAMLCGESWEDNIHNGAYFEPAQRNPKWAQASFIGIYRKKRVSHLGKIIASAICRKSGEELIVDTIEFGDLDESQKRRISSLISSASYYPNLANEAHRYYVVDGFLETNLIKTSRGGMMGHRYFDIDDLVSGTIHPDTSTEEIANSLSGKTYA